MTRHTNWPGGVQTVTPYFTVDDANLLIGFLVAAFEGQVSRMTRSEDGIVKHARVLIGECTIMINQSGPEYPPQRSQMHLYVRDLAATHAAALENGATGVMAPNRRPHGDMMAGICDPCGNTWWIAQPG